MPTIAVPFVPVSSEHNPNIKGRNSDAYLVSAVVTFASLRRWNPDIELVFVTPSGPDEKWRSLMENLAVKVQHVPFAHVPPPNFARTFLGSLYLLDALNAVEAEYLGLVDPDVFCIAPIDELVQSPHALQVLEMTYPRSYRINGLAPEEADHVHQALGEEREVDYHYGGEFYGVPSSLKPELVARVERAWAESLRRWSDGLPHFTTEEHILNFASATLPRAEVSRSVRRIWTAHGHRTVTGDEGGLLLWHLPAEKERGFKKLFAVATDSTSWFWTSDTDEFVRRSGKAFGFHGRGPVRRGMDLVGAAKRTVEEHVAARRG